jgi:hypothetical protein
VPREGLRGQGGKEGERGGGREGEREGGREGWKEGGREGGDLIERMIGYNNQEIKI